MPPSERVDHEGDVEEARPGRDVAEVRHPQHVRGRCAELPVDPVERTRRSLVADRRSNRLATYGTLQTHAPHQARDRAAGHRGPLPAELPPDLAHAVDPEVLIEHASDLDRQSRVPPCSCRQPAEVGSPRGMGVICRRGGGGKGSTCMAGGKPPEGIGSTRQIGSTPKAARWSSMKAIMAGTGGRAPPGQNTRSPCAGSRWLGAAHGSPAPAP